MKCSIPVKPTQSNRIQLNRFLTSAANADADANSCPKGEWSGAAGFWSDDSAASAEAAPMASEAAANATANDARRTIDKDLNLKRSGIKIGVRIPRSTR